MPEAKNAFQVNVAESNNDERYKDAAHHQPQDKRQFDYGQVTIYQERLQSAPD